MKSIKLILLMLSVIILSSCEECEDCTNAAYFAEPSNIISVKQAKWMYDIYTKRRVVPIKFYEKEYHEDETFKPTRYVEFDLETIKHYITYIENEADLAGVDSIKTLRIYLGAYPEDGIFEDGVAAKYTKQNSVFIVPTAEHGGENLGFFTRGEEGSDSRHPVYLKDMDTEVLIKTDGKSSSTDKFFEASMFSSFLNQDPVIDDRSLILNDGNVVPPPKMNTDMGPSDDDPSDDDPNDPDPTKIDPQDDKPKDEEIKEQITKKY